MKKSLKLLFLMIIFTSFNLASVSASDLNDCEKLGLFEFGIENNFLGFGDLTSEKAFESLIQNNQYIPEEILLSETSGLRIPLSRGKYGWGVILEADAWGNLSGDYIKFSRDSKKRLPGHGKYYEITGEGEIYATCGLYQSLTFSSEAASIVIFAKVFNCPEYFHLKADGQILALPGINDNAEVTVNGSYQRQQLAAGGTGWGAGLGCELKLGAEESWNLVVNIDLPAIVYITKLQQENGVTDTEQILNPFNFSGKATENSAWITLPLQASGKLNLPVWIGKVQLNGAISGSLAEYSLGYICPVYQDFMVSGAYNPVMDSLNLGLNWRDWELVIVYGFVREQITGLALSYRF